MGMRKFNFQKIIGYLLNISEHILTTYPYPIEMENQFRIDEPPG